DKPVNNNNYCAPLSVIQFNASTSSYDGDQLDTASDIGIAEGTLSTWTKTVGELEGISGEDISGEGIFEKYFVGTSGESNNQLCTPKTVSDLSTVTGTCPDAPRLEGTYQIAGLAHYARKNGFAFSDDVTKIDRNTGQIARASVRTYGVSLAPAVPKVIVPVPGDNTGKAVTILPACRNITTIPAANCAIVDFKIINQDHVGDTYTGSLYVDWEDSEQGGDYDQDMWGLIKYEITSTEAKITTQVIAQATDHKLGFGYVIGGTLSDGFHVQSGVNKFTYSDLGFFSCVNEVTTDR